MVEKISMNVDETLELEYLVEQISDDTISITDEPTSGSSSVDYIATQKGVFNPSETGTHKLDINGQTVEIDVTDIPDSGLLHNYDAQSLGYSNGTTVSIFSDKEGSNDASANGSPTMDTSAINGHEAVGYDGSDDEHLAPSAATLGTSDAYCFAGVVRPRTVSSTVHIYENGVSNGGYTTGFRDDSNTHEWDIYHQGVFYEGSGSTSPQPYGDTNYIVIMTYDGSTITLEINGTIVQTVTKNVNSPSGDLSIGSRGGTRWAHLYVGQLLFYDEHKSSAERDEIRSGLESKWSF
jgi:hypothetical protein